VNTNQTEETNEDVGAPNLREDIALFNESQSHTPLEKTIPSLMSWEK
jgi:hypothetical protein